MPDGYTGPTEPFSGDSDNTLLKKIAASIDAMKDAGGAGGGGAQTVTPLISLVGEGLATIPAGAKGWSFSVLTGTALVNGAEVSAGFSDSDPNTLADIILIDVASNSSVYVRYNA